MTDRVLADFLGTWCLERRMHHADGAEAGFSGAATWTPQGARALYAERGQLHMNGQVFEAERRYLWQADLWVCFEDGRPFHRVPPQGGVSEHWCDPDQYHVRYDFARWPDWTAIWTVKGPRKDYVLTTRYRPGHPSA